MRLFQVLDAQGRLCPGALAGSPNHALADVATAGQAGFATTLDLLTAVDQDGLDLAGWFDEQRRGGVTVSVDWAALERTGKAGGYTLANDVSAWDIERDNPLYLPQSKVYDGCFSCGPTIVTPDEVTDPYAIDVTMVVSRGTTEVFKGSASTGQLKRKLPDLVEWLRKSNGVPTGTILSTGTGIIQPLGSGLEPGDVVVISSPQLGTLSNPVAFV